MMSQTIAAPSARIFYKERTPITAKQAAYWGITGASALAVVYLLSVFATGAAWLPIGANMETAELRLSLIECLLGLVALNIPAAISKVCRVELPDALCVSFYIFIFCATVLGELFSMYYALPCWDVILHGASGVMIGLLGGILAADFLRKKNCEKLITPALIAVVTVCFALCVGVVWEIYEFSADALLGLNMQKTMLENGTELAGKAAVFDTMKDLIMDFLGGTAAAVYGAVSLKRRKGAMSVCKKGYLTLGEIRTSAAYENVGAKIA